jgi:(R)-2-hydroxyglutarate---pyruvate transhydrogenase
MSRVSSPPLTRLQCSNERPFCQKCISSGRECEGYSRDRVFITGTPANKGRVASHPKKCTQSRRQENRSSAEPRTKMDVSLTQPLTSAWNDHTSLSANGVQRSVVVTALPTKLDNLVRSGEHEELDKSDFRLENLPYVPADFHGTTGYNDIDASAYCLLGLADSDDASDHSGENFCAFLYEVGIARSLFIRHRF